MNLFLSMSMSMAALGVSPSLNAYDIFPITQYSRSDRDGVINLSSSYRPQMTATVDCNSFLMGLTYHHTQGTNQFLYLYDADCFDILETIDLWFQNNETACLSVDFDLKLWNLTKGADLCPRSK